MSKNLLAMQHNSTTVKSRAIRMSRSRVVAMVAMGTMHLRLSHAWPWVEVAKVTSKVTSVCGGGVVMMQAVRSFEVGSSQTMSERGASASVVTSSDKKNNQENNNHQKST